MNKMQLKILGTDGTELIVVPFDTDHVTWAIRNSGFKGRITEQRIAYYIGEIVWRAGNDWDKQKQEWIKLRVATLYQPGMDMAALDAQVQQELSVWLGWNPHEGYDDEGNPLQNSN